MTDDALLLAALRSEVDAIDDRIGALLTRRFAATDAIGRHKARVGEAAEDPDRQAQRAHVLDAIAARHGLPMTIVRGLFDAIKAEVVSRHRTAAAGAPDERPA